MIQVKEQYVVEGRDANDTQVGVQIAIAKAAASYFKQLQQMPAVGQAYYDVRFVPLIILDVIDGVECTVITVDASLSLLNTQVPGSSSNPTSTWTTGTGSYYGSPPIVTMGGSDLPIEELLGATESKGYFL